jgi:hypothetical protein
MNVISHGTAKATTVQEQNYTTVIRTLSLKTTFMFYINNNRSTYKPKFNTYRPLYMRQQSNDYVTNFYVGKDIGSDHFPTITTIRLKYHIQQQQRYFLNWDLFKKTLSSYQEVKYEEINLSNLNQIAEELQKE